MDQKSFGWARRMCGPRTHVAYVVALVVFACLAFLWPATAAQAACTSPQTATITSGGTATFTCADFGFISPADALPSHGSLTFGMPSNTPLIYTNNGDGATSDTFIVKDDNAVPITFNVTINPSASPLTVTPSNVATPAIGTSYNQTLSTSGGTGPYTYSLVAGSNLPPGLTLSSAGVISGTPTGSGPYNFTVRVVDSRTPTANTLDKAYSVLIAAPVIDVTPDSPPDGGVGTAYSVQFSASGGTPGYTYTRDSGSLPAGLSLSGSGLLSGTPSAVGSSTFKLKVQDSTTISTGGVHFLLQDVTVTINAVPPVVLTPTTGTALTAGVVGSSYANTSISATGGAGTITYAVTSGSVPTGLTLNTSTGAITGTPTAGALGTTNFTVTATAAAAGSAAASYSITITAPPVVLAPVGGPLTSGTAGVAYSTNISATGGVGTITYALTAGAFPPGLTMNTSTGAINGTPTAIGTFNFTITATAATSGSVAEAYQIAIVGPPLNLSPASGTALTGGVVGSAYTDTSISASSPLGGVTFSASGLPDGLTINALTGEITGTPTLAALGTASVDVEVMSMFGNVEQATYPITIVTPPVVLTPTTGTALTAGVVGSSYANTSISATGGAGTITYAVTSGSVPAGLALNTSTGAITGTPTAAAFGTTTFSVTATAATSGTASASYTITVVAPPVVLTPASGATLSPGMVGSSYSDTSIAANGGVGALSYAVTSGALPGGLAIDPATGGISGTPTVAGFGTANFTVEATAATAGSASANYTIVVGAPAMVLTPSSGTALSTGTAGSSYSDTSVSASGGAGAISFAVTAGSLPPGLTLNGSTGAITGTPTDAALGLTSFTMMATAATSGTVSASYSIVVVAPTVVLTPASGAALSGGTVGTSYSETAISASGGVGTFNYAVTSGSLPAGLSIDAATGAITGTPTVAAFGTASFSITATATTSGSATANYSITIAEPPVVLTPPGGALAAGVVGVPYSGTSISASGGVGTISYAVTMGTLPAGLTIDAATGAITGTPTAAGFGSANFTVTATAATAGSVSSSYTITVAAPAVVLTPASGAALSAGTVGTSYSETAIAASGGVGTFSYAVTAGALPTGLALDAGTGAISGTPTAGALGTVTFTVTATAAISGAASSTYSIAVGAPAVVLMPTTGTPLSGGTVGAAYSDASISASGGVGTISYAVTAGSLPTGLSLNASNGAISGTPTLGALGASNFSVTATAATSGSATASYSIMVVAVPVVLTPAAGAALSSGTLGVAYSDTSISASGGVGGFTYAVTSGGLPGGLMLDASSAHISGRPTADGDFRFSVTATDASGATGQANYTLSILSSNFVFLPSAGALPEAMGGEAYSARISVTGGVGGLVYSIKSGDLPKGMVLNISTGELTGPIAVDATPDDYRFTIAVVDSRGASGSAVYTLKLKGRAVTVPDIAVDVPAGSTPKNVYLNGGATGGPFVSAAIASVTPPNAGKAEIIEGEVAAVGSFTPVGYYLRFTPNPSYSGSAVIGYTLKSALGTSNVGRVTYRIALDRVGAVEEIDGLVRDFVRTRQNLLSSTVRVPGLLDRRKTAGSTDPVTTAVTPSERGARLGFSSSLAQIQAARDAADAAAAGETFVMTNRPFDIWVNGSFLFHKDKDDKSDKWGNFALFSVGADYLISDHALVGLSFHYDYMTDPTAEDVELTGNG